MTYLDMHVVVIMVVIGCPFLVIFPGLTFTVWIAIPIVVLCANLAILQRAWDEEGLCWATIAVNNVFVLIMVALALLLKATVLERTCF